MGCFFQQFSLWLSLVFYIYSDIIIKQAWQLYYNFYFVCFYEPHF